MNLYSFYMNSDSEKGCEDMPKILKDMEEKIFTTSLNLFGDHGYKKVNMKMIAKELGIAVGTLYNYYPNKKQLFLSVFENSWSNTVSRVNESLASKSKADDKIDVFFNVFFEEIKTRKGLGKTFFMQSIENTDDEYNNRIAEVEKQIYSCINNLIIDLEQYHNTTIEPSTRERLASTLVVIVFSIKKEFPDEEEKNMKFIKQILNTFINKRHR